jgi:hypothetical protein
MKTSSASKIAAAFRSLYKALENVLRTSRRAYDKKHMIEYNLLRVLKHLQEWKVSPDKTPFLLYTDAQKKQVLQKIKMNRKRLAQQQVALPVRPTIAE